MGALEGALIRDAGLLAAIPGVLIHGRRDMSCPIDTAWALSGANLRAQGFYAHAGFEPDGRTRHFDFKTERIIEWRYRRALSATE